MLSGSGDAGTRHGADDAAEWDGDLDILRGAGDDLGGEAGDMDAPGDVLVGSRDDL